MKENKTIVVQRRWIEELARLAKEAKDSKYDKFKVADLVGYASSAEFILTDNE